MKAISKFLLYLVKVVFEAIILGIVLYLIITELARRGYLNIGG